MKTDDLIFACSSAKLFLFTAQCAISVEQAQEGTDKHQQRLDHTMTELKNPMDVFKLLDRSNCGECGEKTCMSFAAAVFRGQKDLSDCTHLDRETVERFRGATQTREATDREMEEALEALKQRIPKVDLAEAAERVGGRYSNQTLTVKVLGKDFHVRTDGSLSAEIHVNPWVTIPVLNAILEGRGDPVSGKWVPFRELKEGKPWTGLFEQRVEKPLKQVADTTPELFEDMLDIFSGREIEKHHDADVSIVLHPLPKAPILICYWKPEEELDSSLHLFFDANVLGNINLQSIFALGSGFVQMFEKLARRHSQPPVSKVANSYET